MKSDCNDFAERKWAYLDGTLDEADRVRVDRHLAGCKECRRLAAELEGTWALLDAFDEIEVSPSFVSRTLDAVKSREAARGPRRALKRALYAAAAVLLIGLGLMLFRPDRDAAPSPQASDAPPLAAEEDLLKNLDLIEDLDFLEEYGEELELAMEYDLFDLLNETEKM